MPQAVDIFSRWLTNDSANEKILISITFNLITKHFRQKMPLDLLNVDDRVFIMWILVTYTFICLKGTENMGCSDCI